MIINDPINGYFIGGIPHFQTNPCRDVEAVVTQEVTVFSVTVTCFPFTILSKWKHCHDDADDAERQDLGIENHGDWHDQHTFVHFYLKYRRYAGLYSSFCVLVWKIALALLWWWYWSSSLSKAKRRRAAQNLKHGERRERRLHLLLCWNWRN